MVIFCDNVSRFPNNKRLLNTEGSQSRFGKQSSVCIFLGSPNGFRSGSKCLIDGSEGEDQDGKRNDDLKKREAPHETVCPFDVILQLKHDR